MVISCNEEPYISLEHIGCRKTWASSNHKNIDILFVHSLNYLDVHRDGSNLYVHGNEHLYNIGYKTLNAFKYALSNCEFDYIYRTNLSSYIHQAGLYDYVNTLPDSNIYQGVVGYYNGIEFASGSGYLISKDLVKYVTDNEMHWDHINLIDDVAIASVLRGNNVYPTPISRIDIKNEYELSTFDTNTIDQCFHFRCKSETDRTHDIRVMNKLHDYFINTGCIGVNK